MVNGCYSTPRVPVTIITYNAGLLRAFGGLLQPAPFVAERRAAMPRAFAASGGDIIVLQEVYGDTNRRVLAAALGYIASQPRSSLLALSSAPIRGAFVAFDDVPIEERLLDRKGVLIV